MKSWLFYLFHTSSPTSSLCLQSPATPRETRQHSSILISLKSVCPGLVSVTSAYVSQFTPTQNIWDTFILMFPFFNLCSCREMCESLYPTTSCNLLWLLCSCIFKRGRESLSLHFTLIYAWTFSPLCKIHCVSTFSLKTQRQDFLFASPSPCRYYASGMFP